MKKNLKKVISAVLALTLAMSSFVALATTTSAATFADVADTANYAEAVNALAALGAIAGYEDGTFLPDNNITRAEVATMIVAALNKTQDAKNSGSTTKFADVNASAAWAAGYVNVGVADGYISGMTATEFAPSANVTYAQVLSMLTRIIGYGDFAVAQGGWPDGYLKAASTAGILSGVTAATNDAMTRAQVAQLIWNTLQAPVLDAKTLSLDPSKAELYKLDGKDGEFKTTLSDRFDAYVLNVEVVGTAKTAGLELGEVQVKFTGNNEWNPEEEDFVKELTDAENTKTADAGKTDIANYVFSSGKIVVEYNDDAEWTVLYFAPTSKVATKTIDGTLIADVDTANKVLKVYKSKNTSATTTYKLSDIIELYVNGVEFAGATDADIEAMLEASSGNAILYQDSNESGTKYNKIMVDVYAYASVSQVKKSGDDIEIKLTSKKNVSAPDMALEELENIDIVAEEIEEGNKVVKVTRNGAAVEATALVKEDVVAVKYDLLSGVADSDEIEIIATDAKVSGKFISYDDIDEIFNIGGEKYTSMKDDAELGITRGASYTFRLDPQGGLFLADDEVTSINYAIVEKHITDSSSSEYDYMEVMTFEGTSKRLYIASTAENDVETLLSGMGITNKQSDAAAIDPSDRVISYEVNKKDGQVKSVNQVTVETFTGAEYDSEALKIGKIVSSTAAVLDATAYMKAGSIAKNSDYKASSLASLVNGVDYDGFVFHMNNDGDYTYVVITKAGSIFGETSDFAVVAADASASSMTTTENDDDVYTLRVIANGDSKWSTMNVAEDVVVYKGATSYDYADGIDYLTRGSVFFYTVDGDGYVDQITVVVDGIDGAVVLPRDEDVKDGVWGTAMDDRDAMYTENTVIQMFVAPVVKATASKVTFASDVEDGRFNARENTFAFTLREDSKVYGVDVSEDADNNWNDFGTGAFEGIETKEVDADGWAYYGTAADEAGEYDHEGFQKAVVMVVDGVITNALIYEN